MNSPRSLKDEVLLQLNIARDILEKQGHVFPMGIAVDKAGNHMVYMLPLLPADPAERRWYAEVVKGKVHAKAKPVRWVFVSEAWQKKVLQDEEILHPVAYYPDKQECITAHGRSAEESVSATQVFRRTTDGLEFEKVQTSDEVVLDSLWGDMCK